MKKQMGIPPISLREAVAIVISQLDAPISRDELVQRVLRLHPSQARRPAALIIAEVRRQTDMVRLEDGRYAPPEWILRGARFRYIPSAEEVISGAIPLFPCFIPFFLERNIFIGLAEKALQHPILVDEENGETIDYDLFNLPLDSSSLEALEHPASFPVLNLRSWLREKRIVFGDSLLLMIQDPRAGVFQMKCEAASDMDRAAVAIQDATLEAEIVALVDHNPSEQPFIEEIIPAAFANLHEATRRYPGNHWYTVVSRSSRLRAVDDYGIARSTFRRPIDRLMGYTGSAASEKELEVRVAIYNAEQSRILGLLLDKQSGFRSAGASRSPEEALRLSMRQIGLFLMQTGTGQSSEERCRCLAIPAVYLAKHEGVSLSDADFPMLCRFLLSYYPRRVLFNRKAFTGRMLSLLRSFYERQADAGNLSQESTSRKLSRLHGLVDRKVVLAGEIDLTSPQSARLYGQLFPDSDKEDYEVMTISLRDDPYFAG